MDFSTLDATTMFEVLLLPLLDRTSVEADTHGGSRRIRGRCCTSWSERNLDESWMLITERVFGFQWAAVAVPLGSTGSHRRG